LGWAKKGGKREGGGPSLSGKGRVGGGAGRKTFRRRKGEPEGIFQAKKRGKKKKGGKRNKLGEGGKQTCSPLWGKKRGGKKESFLSMELGEFTPVGTRKEKKALQMLTWGGEENTLIPSGGKRERGEWGK